MKLIQAIKNIICNVCLILFAIIIAACSSTSNQSKQLIALQDLPGWQEDNMHHIREAFMRGCHLDISNLTIKKTKFYSWNKESFQQFCAALKTIQTHAELRNFFQEHFVAVLSKKDTALATAYFEAKITLSETRDSVFRWPVYGHPLQHINNSPSNTSQNTLLPTRSDIETNGIDAPILGWTNSYIDLFLLHIQGSGVADFYSKQHQKPIRRYIGYASSNQHPYVSIATWLVENQMLPKGGATWPAIKNFLETNQHLMEHVLQQNPRYIFFSFKEQSAVGHLGVQLTPKRSGAFDPIWYGPMSLLWFSSNQHPASINPRMIIAQDRGSAIKGVGRLDLFWGEGQQALDFAGQLSEKGSLYVIQPK